MAAIEVTVLQGMSIPHTNDVYRGWALPGGVGVERWQMTANVQAFLAAAQMDQQKDLSASIVVVFFCAIAYMVLPGLVDSLMGSGCIGGGSQPSAKATKK